MAQKTTRTDLITALDVGTTKVCCLIARADDSGPKIIGIGHHASQGLRAGSVIDMDGAEASIRSTVASAEQMAGETVENVIVNISCGRPHSKLIAYEVSVAGHEISDQDLRGIIDPAAHLRGDARDHELLHAIPVGYTIDGARGVKDPRGMFGDKLGVNMHLVSTAAGPVRNLETCIDRCLLRVEAKVAAPYAAALAALANDEKELGVTCIDMGGGVTSMAVFFDGELVHTDSVPVGGMHVTNDIARGLGTPISHAERMKTLYGSALPSSTDDREVICVPLVGKDEEGDANQISRSVLVAIVRPRIEETFELVRARLEEAGFHSEAGRRIVLTGGASQLPGTAEVATAILDKQVRLGRPRPVDGLAEAVGGPAFAASVGLLDHAIAIRTEAQNGAYQPAEERPPGRLGRIGQWLREHL